MKKKSMRSVAMGVWLSVMSLALVLVMFFCPIVKPVEGSTTVFSVSDLVLTSFLTDEAIAEKAGEITLEGLTGEELSGYDALIIARALAIAIYNAAPPGNAEDWNTYISIDGYILTGILGMFVLFLIYAIICFAGANRRWMSHFHWIFALITTVISAFVFIDLSSDSVLGESVDWGIFAVIGVCGLVFIGSIVNAVMTAKQWKKLKKAKQ